jgi:hypothetical protein
VVERYARKLAPLTTNVETERERQRKTDKIGVGVGIGIGVEKEIGMAFGHEKLDVYRAAFETWA